MEGVMINSDTNLSDTNLSDINVNDRILIQNDTCWSKEIVECTVIDISSDKKYLRSLTWARPFS